MRVRTIGEENSLHPYELVEGTRGLKQLSQRAQSLNTLDSDLVIEVNFTELMAEPRSPPE